MTEVNCDYFSNHENVWTHIKSSISQLPTGSLTQLGCILKDGRWYESANNTRYAELLSAVRFFAENHLCLENVVAARIGNGVREIPMIKGYTSAVTLLWRPKATYTRFIESESVRVDSESNIISRLRISNDHADWSQLRVLQFLLSSELIHVTEVSGSRMTETHEAADPQTGGGLETIPEGSNETDQSRVSSPSDGHFFTHDDPKMQEELNKIWRNI